MDDASDMVAAQAQAVEQAATRIRELNERLLDSAFTAGARTVDAYERALRNLVTMAEKSGGATPMEWITALVQVHADFVRDVSLAYTAVLRVLLD